MKHASEEILAKSRGNYEKAIAASKRTNADVNRRIEELRKKKEERRKKDKPTHEGHFQTTIRFEDRLGRIA